MKRIVLALSLLTITACGGGGGGSSTSAAPSVEGIDLSGTYNSVGVWCYNTAGTLIADSTFSDYSAKLVISGNTMTTTNTGSNCSYATSQHIVFSTVTNAILSSVVVSNVLNNSCVLSKTLVVQSGAAISVPSATIIPTTSSGGNQGYLLSTVAGVSYLAVVSSATVPSNSSATCFNAYLKQ